MDWNHRMRQDWDRRALEDAEAFIYTGTADFVSSGEANYNQLVRPYLPILLRGKPARDCRAVEIGCGIGRMTEWFATHFGWVDALDVSPAMIESAQQRLSRFSNIAFHVGQGSDLAPLRDASADLVFSYIVFQHIPSRAAIEGYVSDAARVLKPGGTFKFQLNGDQSPEYLAHQRDTWLGEAFSEAGVAGMLGTAGLTPIASEGAGTQYYVITAVKGEPPPRSYVLPGEPWAAPLLLDGFGPAVDASWRKMAGKAKVRLEGHGSRLYLGLYFWPESCHHQLTVAGNDFQVTSPGDHYFECPAATGAIELTLDPPPTVAPAFRIIGLY
jgi:SAM-dependent methyltransferase